MQSQNNSQFMIAKEVFINHIMSQIQEDYQLNANCLGQGGFGTVYEGRRRKKSQHLCNNKDIMTASFSSYETSARSVADQHACNQSRAIKRISYKSADDKELMKNEIQILSYLDHPLIVKLYETYEHKKDLYLVIDLLTGGDLFTVISENDKMSQSQAKVVFLQLIKALSYLHAQNIAHRDLKLENVLFVDKHSYNLKLVDFGLAYCWEENMKKELKLKGLNKKTTGTPDYMSPEMLAHNYDQRCDIWSAGVILYMLLSGTPPFYGETEREIMQRIKSLDYSFDISVFENVSENAKDLIRKILLPEDKRISLDKILEHPWFSDIATAQNIMENRSVEPPVPIKNGDTSSTDLEISIHIIHPTVITRKSSENKSDDTEMDTKCKSQYSDEFTQSERPEQLTLLKLQHYYNLSKLQKLQAIYSVSQLSQSRIKTYGQEFLLIDKDNDGTVSLEDLEMYLAGMETIVQKEKVEQYFNDIALSQRGSISYSEYLACVLSYDCDSTSILSSEMLEFDERCLYSSRLTVQSVDHVIESVDIYDDSMMLGFFSMLDKNKDGFVTISDFIHLLKENGIESQNKGLIEQLITKMNGKLNAKSLKSVKNNDKDEWTVDPRTYKWQLSRTYKGESDGGMMIDFRRFKHLMTGSQWCDK